ncbi:glucose repression mediator protein [Conglomerata obtusa]
MQKKFYSHYNALCNEFSDNIQCLWVDIAHGYAIIGIYDTSIQAYKNALFYDKDNVKALYGLGKLYIAIQDFNNAKEIINQVDSIKNEEFKTSVLKGHYYLKKNEIEKSYKSFEKACETVDEYDSYLLYGVGLFYEAINKNEIAGKIYLRHYNQYNFYDLNVELLFRLGIIYKNDNNEDIAMRIFNVLLQMNDLRSIVKDDVNVQIAHLLEKKQEYKTAKLIAYDILSKNPAHIFSCRLMSWILFKEEKFDELIEFIIKITPLVNDAYVYYILARAYFNQKKFAESFETYRKSILQDKSNPWFWNSIGMLYYKNNQIKEARGKFETAIELEQNFTEAKFNLALCDQIEELVNGEEKSKQELEDLKIKNNLDALEVEPDIENTPYFKAQLFLGGPVYKLDKNKIESYELPIDKIVLKYCE